MRRSSRTGSSSTREDPLAADAVRVGGRSRLSQAALLRCIDLRATSLIRIQPCYRTAVRRPTTGSRVFCSLGNLPGSSRCGFLKRAPTLTRVVDHRHAVQGIEVSTGQSSERPQPGCGSRSRRPFGRGATATHRQDARAQPAPARRTARRSPRPSAAPPPRLIAVRKVIIELAVISLRAGLALVSCGTEIVDHSNVFQRIDVFARSLHQPIAWPRSLCDR